MPSVIGDFIPYKQRGDQETEHTNAKAYQVDERKEFLSLECSESCFEKAYHRSVG
jgi:hypothetical protein